MMNKRSKRREAIERLRAGARDKSPAMQERIGQKIRKLRQERGLSRREFAARAGISVGHLGAMERGALNSTLSTLLAITKVLRSRWPNFLKELDNSR